MKFVIFKDKRKQWRFSLVARNGKIVCTSEGYKTKSNAKATIRTIKWNAQYAGIVELK